MHSLLASLVSLAILLPVPAWAFDVPTNDGYMTDAAGVLTEGEEQMLEDALADYVQSGGSEIAVVIVKTLDGEPMVDAAVQIGRKWGVGDALTNNGVVMLIAYADREVFIAPGYGLEGALPDLVVKGIIDNELAPEFRNGRYAQGILAAVDAIERHVAGEYEPARYKTEETDFSFLPIAVFIGFLLLESLGSWLSRSKSWWMGGVLGGVFGVILTSLFSWWLSIPILVVLGLFFDYIVSKIGPRKRRRRHGGFGSGGFGGGSGGGSSGGFSGFSGGSFGGGGAGGSW